MNAFKSPLRLAVAAIVLVAAGCASLGDAPSGSPVVEQSRAIDLQLGGQ